MEASVTLMLGLLINDWKENFAYSKLLMQFSYYHHNKIYISSTLFFIRAVTT